MNGLFDAAREVCEFMAAQGWKFCLIGGLAVQRWGEPRTTLDIDLTLLTDWGDEARYIDALLARFKLRSPDGRAFALKNRVLLLYASDGKPVDIALGALPFEQDMVNRAIRFDVAPGVSLPCCTAEDLIIMKLFSGRARDLLDAESIVHRQPGLDRSYILEQLAELAELRNTREPLDRARTLFESNP